MWILLMKQNLKSFYFQRIAIIRSRDFIQTGTAPGNFRAMSLNNPFFKNICSSSPHFTRRECLRKYIDWIFLSGVLTLTYEIWVIGSREVTSYVTVNICLFWKIKRYDGLVVEIYNPTFLLETNASIKNRHKYSDVMYIFACWKMDQTSNNELFLICK